MNATVTDRRDAEASVKSLHTCRYDVPDTPWWQGYALGLAAGRANALAEVRAVLARASAVEDQALADIEALAEREAAGKGPAWVALVLGGEAA